MEVVSINATGNGAGDSGGVGASNLGAGIAEGYVEVSQGGQRSEDGPVQRRKLKRKRRIGRGMRLTSLSEGDTRGKEG